MRMAVRFPWGGLRPQAQRGVRGLHLPRAGIKMPALRAGSLSLHDLQHSGSISRVRDPRLSLIARGERTEPLVLAVQCWVVGGSLPAGPLARRLIRMCCPEY